MVAEQGSRSHAGAVTTSELLNERNFMKRQIYVMFGRDPKEWCETVPLGPFTSEMQARKAIREDVEDSYDGCDCFRAGVNADYSPGYHILEYVKGVMPVLNVRVDITLSKTVNVPTSCRDNGDSQ